MRAGQQATGHPVNVATGAVYMRRLDISLKGRFPVDWLRYYSTAALDIRNPQGVGWSTTYSAQLSRAGDSLAFRHREGPAGTFPEAAPRLEQGAGGV